MNVNAPLKASAKLAEGCEPGVGALNDPAMAPKPIIALDAFAGDAVLDTAGPINTDPAEVELAGAAQFVQKQQMQVVPRLRCLPITKAPPAGHSAAESQFLG